MITMLSLFSPVAGSLRLLRTGAPIINFGQDEVEAIRLDLIVDGD